VFVLMLVMGFTPILLTDEITITHHKFSEDSHLVRGFKYDSNSLFD